MSDESYGTVDPIEECIRAVTSVELRQAQDRAWELRSDTVRRREMFRNLQAIQDATKREFDRLQAGLPKPRLEFISNPARFFTVRNGSLTGVTVTAEMSLDGSVITLITRRHDSYNDVQPPSAQTVYVQVEENETYYTYRRKPVTVADIALLILRPVMDSLCP